MYVSKTRGCMVMSMCHFKMAAVFISLPFFIVSFTDLIMFIELIVLLSLWSHLFTYNTADWLV